MSNHLEQTSYHPTDKELSKQIQHYTFISRDINEPYFATYSVASKSEFKHACLYRINAEKLPSRRQSEYIRKFQKLIRFQHPHVMRITEAWNDGDFIYVVTEESRHLNLEKAMEKEGRFSFKDTIEIGLQLCSAVEALSQIHTYHSCLVPQDLVIDGQSYLKISAPLVKRLIIECDPTLVVDTNFGQFTYENKEPENLVLNELKSISAIICYISTGYAPSTMRQDKWVEYGLPQELQPFVKQLWRDEEPEISSIAQFTEQLLDIQKSHFKPEEITQSLTATRLQLNRATQAIPVETTILQPASITEQIKLQELHNQNSNKEIKPNKNTTPLAYESPVAPEDNSVAADLFNQRYLLKNRIFEDDLKTTYLAEDTHMMNTIVWVHIYKENNIEDFASKFRNIYGRIQAITNINVSRIYEQNTVNGVSFMANQRERGEKLADFIARKRLSAQEISQFCRQMIYALRILHRTGLASLSISENNIYVYKNPDGGYMYRLTSLGGFSLANIIKGEEYAFAQIKCPEYLAPEIYHNQFYGMRTTQFVFGQILYKLVTGQHPCSNQSLEDAFQFHSSNPGFELRDSRSDIPHLFQIWLNKLTHRNVNERFTNYDEMLKSLERTQQKFSVPMRPD